MAVKQTPMGRLVSRLCALPAQDTTDLGVEPEIIRNEIGDALTRHSVNIEHAGRIVEFLVYSRWRPGPADIEGAARQTILPEERASQVVTKADPECSECSGTGWKRMTRGGLSGVSECGCRAPRKRGNEEPDLGTPEGVRIEPKATLMSAGEIFNGAAPKPPASQKIEDRAAALDRLVEYERKQRVARGEPCDDVTMGRIRARLAGAAK